MWKFCEVIYVVLQMYFFGVCMVWFVESYVQKQELFDCCSGEMFVLVEVYEYGLCFYVVFGLGYKIGFFVDQCDNCQCFVQLVKGCCVFDLCCNVGGFVVYVMVVGVCEVVGVDMDVGILEIVCVNVVVNGVDVMFEQVDIFDWVCVVVVCGECYDVVIFDLVKFICDCFKVMDVLKKYFVMNCMVLDIILLGGLLFICLCMGLVSEVDFLEMLCWVVFNVGCEIQVLDVCGVGVDYLFCIDVLEGCYFKVVFCWVE